MNMTLGQFQDAFVEALYQRPPAQLEALASQPAFAVYRNTVLAGSVEALRANFPSIERLVGASWMREAATDYARQSPPVDARLITYGAAFPAFLDTLAPSHGLPWLGDVARLDFKWAQAFAAPDEPALDLKDLAAMEAVVLAHAHLRPRQAVHWGWFAAHPVFSLWQCNRQEREWEQGQPWIAEGALLSGDANGVIAQPLEIGGCAFLDACAAGHSLEQASRYAEQTQPDLDFSDLLGRLLGARVFRPLSFD